MGSGSTIDSANDDASFAKANRKQKLLDTGTAIQAATKVGMGQDAYCDSTSSGLTVFTNYELVNTTHYQTKQASILWPVKWGHLQPISTSYGDCAHGLLRAGAVSGSLGIASFTSAEGLSNTFTSGASAGNQTGINLGVLYTARLLNPSYKLRWKIDEAAANIRFFAGFTGSASLIGNSDDPLNALAGFGIAISTAQANYRIFHNDTVGVTVSEDTGIAKDTNYHTIEIWGEDNSSKFWWSLDNSTPVSVAGDVPTQSTGLSCQVIATAVNADAKVMNVQNFLINSEK